MSAKTTPDEVSKRFAESGWGTRITIRQLDDYVLIEAPGKGLRFLGELLLAQAEFQKDCGFQIDKGAKFLSRASQQGVYIHRLPCLKSKPTTRAAKPARGDPNSKRKDELRR
jgi:hypothetical protein